MSATRRSGAGRHDARTAGRGRTPAPSASPFAEAIGPAGDAFEQEADRVAAAIVRGGPLTAPAGWSSATGAAGTIQRKCADCQREEEEQIRRAPKVGAADGPSVRAAAPAAMATPSAAAPDAPAGPAQAAPAWLVDDEGQPSPGQMRKTAFLAVLRREICASVDDAMSGTGRDSAGCPWIDHWLGHYQGRSASQVERALRKYAPEAGTAASARDYLPVVAARVRASAARYAATGEISGVPDDMPGGGAGGGLLGVFGGMFFKARPGGARAAAGRPESVRASLGAGRPLEGGVRARMESALGASFSRVRVHTDATAARLSDRLNAHAFAVGAHVAFGAGTYRPGSPVGDALIAHELAHVVQQGGAERAEAGPDARRVPASAALERDADRAAAGAVRGLWGGPGAKPGIISHVRSGLTLSRCSKGKTPETVKGAVSQPSSKPGERRPIVLGECGAVTETAWETSVKAAVDDKARLALLQGRLCHSTVQLAGTNCTDQEFPDDYAPAPTINYDPRLNTKIRYAGRQNCDGTTKKGGTPPSKLEENAGHSFIASVKDESSKRKERKKYVVLGPKALEKGPLEPQKTAEHELYHVEYHLEDDTTDGDLQEVETYVQDFKKYFARLGSMGRGPVRPDKTQPDVYYGPNWQVLDRYYRRAKKTDSEAVKPYLTQLIDYYTAAPDAAKALMREWITRYKDYEIVKDLRTGLALRE